MGKRAYYNNDPFSICLTGARGVGRNVSVIFIVYDLLNVSIITIDVDFLMSNTVVVSPLPWKT